MKRIEALIPHDRIQDVERALTRSGVEGLTLTSVYCPAEFADEFRTMRKNRLCGKPCCKLEVLVCNDDLPGIQSVLMETVGTDPRTQIVVFHLEATIRIRTGESQEAAIHSAPGVS